MTKRLSGIYRILNKINGKGYVGKATNLPVRWHGHKHHLRKGNHHSPHLQAAWNKYGKDNFQFEILELVEDKTKLVEREQYWINFYDAANPAKGYNVLANANESRTSPHSEETRKKIGDGNRGKFVSLETRKKQSEALLGPKHPMYHKKLPKEWHDRVVKALIGRAVSEETKEKLRIINTGKEHKKQPQTAEFKDGILEFCVKNGFRPSKWSVDIEEKNLGNHLKHYIDKNGDQFDLEFSKEIYKFPAWQQFKKLQKEQQAGLQTVFLEMALEHP